MNNLKIGSFLQALRKAKGLTQAEVAEYFEISAKTVSKWECGDSLPEIPMLKALAEFYNVSVDEILNGEKGENKSLEKTRQKNELFFYEKKMSKLIFSFILSLSILAFGFLMLYVLGYTTNRSDVGGWVSIAIYFLAAIALVFGIYLAGGIDEDFDQGLIRKFKRSRLWFIYSFVFAAIFALACSLIFYALPGAKEFVLVIKDFLWLNFLVLLVVTSVASLYPYTLVCLKNHGGKFSNIIYSLLYLVLSLGVIVGVCFAYIFAGEKVYFTLPLPNLEITVWYRVYLEANWMYWFGLVLNILSLGALWYSVLKKKTYIFSMLIQIIGTLFMLIAVSDLRHSSSIGDRGIHHLYTWLYFAFYGLIIFTIIEFVLLILRYRKNKKEPKEIKTA